MYNYNLTQGNLVISSDGSKKVNESISFISQLYSQIYSSHNTKFAIDSAYETGDIYYCSYDDNFVKKIKYDGTQIGISGIIKPKCVSVIQNSWNMPDVIVTPSSDLGCWISNNDGILYKTDARLDIRYTFDRVPNIQGIVSDTDDGCYVIDRTSPALIKFSSTAALTWSFPLTYTPIDIARDWLGAIWVMGSNNYVYNYTMDMGVIIENFRIYPLGNLDRDPVYDKLAAIDVDRKDNSLYVTGGDNTNGWIQKYNYEGAYLCKNELDMAFPYIVKVTQGNGSNGVYVLSDPEKWYEFGHDSSSSSSSSSIDSSSSSSIDSSSSSSL